MFTVPIHNFSDGVLASYFHYNSSSLINKKQASFFSLKYRGRRKTYVNEQLKDKELQKIKQLQKEAPIYSKVQLDLEKRTVVKEIAYDFDQVFDPLSYKNRKKRYNKLIYPFNYLTKNGYHIEIAQSSDFKQIETLHTKWVQYKLNDPRTFKIMFPQKRYIQVCEKAQLSSGVVNKEKTLFDLKQESKLNPIYVMLVIKKEDNIHGVRVVSIERNCAFDLAFFGGVDSPSQLMNYFNIASLKYLYQNNHIRYFNTGMHLNKNLRTFKTQYPYIEVHSEMYGRIK